MQRNIAAFTAIGNSYPEFVSINEQPTGNVTIHVRAKPIDGAEGNHGYIELWPEQWAEIKRQIRAFDAPNGGLAESYQFRAPDPHSATETSTS